jgi:hypothetical protein
MTNRASDRRDFDLKLLFVFWSPLETRLTSLAWLFVMFTCF